MMPFVTRNPPPPIINPRPRVRALPASEASPTPPEATDAADVKPASPTPSKKAGREKKQPTGDYVEGYCRAPIRSRFQPNNPGGPGRPKKDSKSQDDLTRAELLKFHNVTEGGRKRRKTARELLPGLIVKSALQKLSLKDLRILNEEARRLFPERPVEEALMNPIDPDFEREYVRDMIAGLRIGEPAGDGADPLADFVTSVFEADDDEEDAPGLEEDQDVENGEEDDEAA